MCAFFIVQNRYIHSFFLFFINRFNKQLLRLLKNEYFIFRIKHILLKRFTKKWFIHEKEKSYGISFIKNNV